jgi:hypothetical protein
MIYEIVFTKSPDLTFHAVTLMKSPFVQKTPHSVRMWGKLFVKAEISELNKFFTEVNRISA